MANRLQFEDSPYLQQHKDNPIDWYPWCEEAFKKADDEQKPIFISIGYSSCHWCHVMEKEVFEDEETAKFVNKHFICIKVDREERPDIDKHYQEVYQLLNRRAGGWPTSIFATPQNKPFYAGTYIPLHNKAEYVNMMGFTEITKIIAEKIAQKDEQIFKNAEEIVSFLKPAEHPKEATKLTEDFYKNFILQAQRNFDKNFGGFSVSPKFPHASTLNTLLNISSLYNSKEARDMVTFTLDNMIQGGMYDLVDGGFCRYSTDERWLVPHFEKMTYDNALLCGLYAKACLAYENEDYLHIAKQSADFMMRFMQEDDLFYSASDADSDEGEGAYFTYLKEEIETALAAEGYENGEITAILKFLHVSKRGNFEGRNIIRYEESVKPDWYDNVIRILGSLREKREYPFIDKKVQTSWNAMMTKALFMLGQIENSYTDAAKRSLDALLNTMYKEGELYHSALIHKEPKVKAFLEDYAFMGTALIAAYEQTGDESYLITAQRFANRALEEFYDNGRWFFSKGEFTTQAETTDNTYPSAISVMVDLLLSLGTLIEEKYTRFAFKTLEYNSYDLGRKPIYSPYMLDQTLRYLKGDRIIKSKMNNLHSNSKIIAQIRYPYILKQPSSNDDFLVCGTSSCFANTDKTDKINEIVDDSVKEG
ncbi:thioredoxin domain-containing protein [Sulfurimonas sp. HSL-1716]|uniref:thioredoxin domain-containing protein n=1 Tax=Hydrocurvibacter sulfurireducens TaxID=3131937 RepID=UPI0031FA297B